MRPDNQATYQGRPLPRPDKEVQDQGLAEGVPMTLELTVTDLAKDGAPFTGVAVYVWHCDAAGRYSLYSDGVTDQNYLRGVQLADATGTVRFTASVANLATVSLAGDNVFGDDGASQLATVTGDVTGGLTTAD